MSKIIKKPYLIVVTSLFILSVISGAVDTLHDPEGARRSYDFLTDFLGSIRNKSTFEIFIFIFLNNSLKVLFSILLFFLFGIYPILMIVTNGLMIGSAGVIFANLKSQMWFIAAILPHGIIEIPVFLLTMAASLRLGIIFFQNLVKGKKDFKLEFRKTLIFFFKFLLPLYLVAAFVEAYVTPRIINLFNS